MLLLFAHPALEHSHVNRHLFEAASDIEGVEARDLYELYPDYDVDVTAEQEALLRHDRIVFQHPIYWYSVPPLLKQWQDLVLEHGWAYGHDGTQLHGKVGKHAMTAGGPEVGYGPGGVHRFALTELLRPLEQTAHLCGMEWSEPFVVFGAHHKTTPEIEEEARRYVATLQAFASGEAAA